MKNMGTRKLLFKRLFFHFFCGSLAILLVERKNEKETLPVAVCWYSDPCVQRKMLIVLSFKGWLLTTLFKCV